MKRVSVNRVMNKTIIKGSPIKEIAMMFDEKMPKLISEMVDVVDSSSKAELMKWVEFEIIGKWDEDYYNDNKHDLLVFFAAEFFEMTDFVQKEGHEQYDDYLIYIFFFTQYRRLTGKNLRKDMKFVDILLEYQNIENENWVKTFVYSDDPEGERTYNLFLYDDYKLDFYEESTQLSFIDRELADRCSELMNNSFDDDSISYIRKFNLIRYLNPEFANFLDDLGVFYFTRNKKEILCPTVFNEMINDTEDLPFDDAGEDLLFDSFVNISNGEEDLPFDDAGEELPFDSLVDIQNEIDDLPFALPLWNTVESELSSGYEISRRVSSPKEKVKEIIIHQISLFSNRCMKYIYINSDVEDNKKEIDKLNKDIQSLYGNISWYDIERKLWIEANVPDYLTQKEFQDLVDDNKKTNDMIRIYNYLFSLGQMEYIVYLVEHLKRVFNFVLENEMMDVDSEEMAIDILFRLTDKINAYYYPVFEIIAKEKDNLKLLSIKDPYNVRYQLDATKELRLQMGFIPSDAWLLQEQIYLCAYRFEELCMILHLLVVTLEMSKDKDDSKRIANKYRYLFKNITNHIFRDFLATDVFVENKKYNIKVDKENLGAVRTANIMVDNLLLALDKMLQTDNLIELSESKGMIINSLRILGGNDELIESVIIKLEHALVEKCKRESGFSEVYNELKQEIKDFPVSVSDKTINTLSTAEYFYKKYILKMVERETFDYSCFSILYFQALESALNELLYIPYKLRYEAEIIKEANLNDGKVDDYYCVPSKVIGLVVCKNGKYIMSEQLTLGSMAFFCSGMEYNPNKKELVRFVRSVFNNPDYNVKKLVSFGKELLKISKIRNDAAHASENLSAERFIESKDCVFNKSLTTELRNMLWRFLEFFK